MTHSVDWTRVEELFERAIELPVDQQRAFLESECASDGQLFEEVFTLVRSHFQAGEQNLLTQVVAESVQHWANESRSSIARPDSPAAPEDKKNALELKRRLEQIQPDIKVLETISWGGMGIVFRARQKSLGRDVAVKVMRPSQMDSIARDRFLRESRATARIRNDHVVQIFSVEDTDELTYLVMELIRGVTLKGMIHSESRLSPRSAARIAVQIATGLQAAHDQGLIHRDVKPANVVLDAAGGNASKGEPHANLIDFGIARDMGSDGPTLANAVVGTPAYMSPEQLFTPLDTDLRSDVYGLGMTLYEMLSGSLPFQGAPHMVMRQVDSREPAPLRKLDDRIPRDLESICLKAISKLPAQRYQSAAEMAEDLQRFLDGRPTHARSIPQSARMLRWCNRNRGVSAAVLLAAMLTIALVSGSLLFAIMVGAKNREITRHRTESLESRIKAVVDAHPGHLQDAIQNLHPVEVEAVKRFEKIIHAPEHGVNRKVNSAIALATVGNLNTDLLVDSIDDVFVSPDVCNNLIFAFQFDDASAGLLARSLAEVRTPEQCARRIILLAHLGNFDPWQEAASDHHDPTIRTELIHHYANWHGNVRDISDALLERRHESWAWTLCEVLCEIDPRSLDQPTLQVISDHLRQLSDAKDYVTFHYAQLALRHLAPDRFDKLSFDHVTCRSFPGGYHLVRIEPATTELGRFDGARFERDHPPRKVILTRPYYISDTEVSVLQYAQFAVHENESLRNVEEWLQTDAFNRTLSPSMDHPVQQVSWSDAVRFCNWLSRQNGLAPAYELALSDLGENVENVSDWKLVDDANGFRLPTDAEWEFASRKHSQTRYFFGRDERYFDDYGVGSSGRAIQADPVRRRRPNANGLYGMLGNVWEWVHNRYEFESVGEQAWVNPQGPDRGQNGRSDRVYQGGGINTAQGGIDSESRGHGPPAARYSNLGFRIVLPGEVDDLSD